jgi:MFS superfamily sulfate permease-like transporter
MSSSNENSGPGVVTTAAGMVIGALTGLAVWLTTDLFVFFPVFIGVGFVLGMVFKEAKERRNKV